MNYELKRMQVRSFDIIVKYYHATCLDCLNKITQNFRIISVRAEIRTRCLATLPKRYLSLYQYSCPCSESPGLEDIMRIGGKNPRITNLIYSQLYALAALSPAPNEHKTGYTPEAASTLDNRKSLIRDGICTYMHRLTTGIRSEKCVVRRFRCCANVYLHKSRQYSLLHT